MYTSTWDRRSNKFLYGNLIFIYMIISCSSWFKKKNFEVAGCFDRSIHWLELNRLDFSSVRFYTYKLQSNAKYSLGVNFSLLTLQKILFVIYDKDEFQAFDRELNRHRETLSKGAGFRRMFTMFRKFFFS